MVSRAQHLELRARLGIKAPVTNVLPRHYSPVQGSPSPWGVISSVKEFAPGITLVKTRGGGGVHVSPELLEAMPDFMQFTDYSAGGWFEEGIDWPLPFVCFEEQLRAAGDSWTVRILDNGAHLKTFAEWHADRYKRFFGVEISGGADNVADADKTRPAMRMITQEAV